jgi:hypothetical protein
MYAPSLLWLSTLLGNLVQHSDIAQQDIHKQGSNLDFLLTILLIEKCVTDCNEGQGAYCGGLANPMSDNLFANPRSCCENEVPWRFLEFCEVSLFSVLHTNEHFSSY